MNLWFSFITANKLFTNQQYNNTRRCILLITV
uniref:Uncharacterized protein n=1 Tax=Arundo donax TaxID=35708 RepID=A0A0A9AGU6_ARUDO